MLRKHVGPDEILISNGPSSMTFALVFYADRKTIAIYDPEKIAAFLDSTNNLPTPTGGLLLRDEDVPRFQNVIDRLGWRGPMRTPGYQFWDANP